MLVSTLLDPSLLRYVPKRLVSHVVEAYRDSDGIWIHGDDSFCGPCGYHSLHCYTVSELRDELRSTTVVGG